MNKHQNLMAYDGFELYDNISDIERSRVQISHGPLYYKSRYNRIMWCIMAEKDNENKELLDKASVILWSVSDNPSTPRNIRKLIKDSIDTLKDDSLSVGVRAANAISMLEDVSQDPNIPSFSRVTIWSAVSSLESIRD